MPVAVLHDEFTPAGGHGGVCATGEIIVGSDYSYADSWGYETVTKGDRIQIAVLDRCCHVNVTVSLHYADSI